MWKHLDGDEWDVTTVFTTKVVSTCVGTGDWGRPGDTVTTILVPTSRVVGSTSPGIREVTTVNREVGFTVLSLFVESQTSMF